jgi:hypothetical protein
VRRPRRESSNGTEVNGTAAADEADRD